MSDSLMPYLVSTQELRSLFGCKDQEFLDQIIEECADDLDQIEDALSGTFEEDGRPNLNAIQAVGEIINGQFSASHFNMYVAVLEMIIRSYFGKLLPNRFMQRGWEQFEQLDQLFASLGLDLKLTGLADARAHASEHRVSETAVYPVPLPPNPDLGMSFGCWSAEQIRRNWIRFEQLECLPTDPAEAGAAQAVKGWLQAAVATPDPMIVGFCY